MRINYRLGQRKSLTLADIPTGSHGLAVAHDDKSLAITDFVEPRTDVAKMTASARINTDAVDYEDEVIVASGVNISNYVQNPVVMWDHGKSLTTLPIASSASPDGELDLERSDYTIDATSYFSQSLPLARQIFGLIDEGVVRATSIHVVPSMQSVYTMNDGTDVLVTEESDLIEWSWCPFGVNPEAVRRMKSLNRYPDRFREAWSLQMDHAAIVLSRGSLGGDVLLPAIRKSLTAMMPKPRKFLVNPFDSSRDAVDMKKHLTIRELGKLSRRAVKSLTIDEHDEATQDRIKSLLAEDDEQEKSLTEDELEKCRRKSFDGTEDDQAKSGLEDVLEEGEPVDKSGEETEPEIELAEDGEQKLGAKVLQEAHDAVAYVVEYLKETLSPVENETVKSGLTGELKALSDSLDAIKGIYKSAYPDMPAIGEEATQAKSVEMEDQIKSMLAANQRSQYQTLGLQSMISRLATDQSIPAAKRKSLRMVEDKLGRIVTSAQSYKPTAASGYVPVADMQRLEASFNQLLAKVESMVLPASEG
jgi:hypothetical protein